MIFFDIVVGALLVWGLYRGLKNGLFVEIASLVALIVGIYGAIHFSHVTADYMMDHADWPESYIRATAFLATFFCIVLLVHFAGRFLTKIANFAMLGFLTKISGGIFGTLKFALVIGALLIFFERIPYSTTIVDGETEKKSIFYGPIKEMGALVFSFVLEERYTGAKQTEI